MKNSFNKVCMNENNDKWNNVVSRQFTLYSRNNDIRSEFERDFIKEI